MKLSLLPLASAPTQGELFLVDSLTAWLQYPLAPPFGRGQFASMAGHSLDNLRFPQEVVSGHFQGLSPVPLFFFLSLNLLKVELTVSNCIIQYEVLFKFNLQFLSLL